MKKEFLNLGKQPIANNFRSDDKESEFFYDLKVVFDEETDECIALREYVEQDETILSVDEQTLKLDKKLGLLKGNRDGLD